MPRRIHARTAIGKQKPRPFAGDLRFPVFRPCRRAICVLCPIARRAEGSAMRKTLPAVAWVILAPWTAAGDERPPQVPPADANSVREDHQGTLKALREQRARLASQLGPNHPDVATLD